MQRLRAELALTGVTIIWGTTFVVVKSALASVSTSVFLALRFGVAAAALLLIYRTALRKSGIAAGALAGALLFAAYVFQTEGLSLTTPAKSAFLTGLAIPLVPFVSSCVYRSKPRLVEVAGILVASFGMVLMTWPSGAAWTIAGLRAGISRGDIFSFLCAVTFAFHIVVLGHYSQLHGFEPMAVAQVATAAVLASFFLLLTGIFRSGPARFHLTPGVAIAVLATGLLATALAFTTQAWAQQYTSPSRAALIFTLEPPVAWLTSFVLTGERMANRGKVGAGMILAGILLVELTRTRFVTIPATETSEVNTANPVRAEKTAKRL